MRSALRISDLKARGHTATRLMNVKIPIYLADEIARLSRELGASKTEVVLALLNEGLSAATSKRSSR